MMRVTVHSEKVKQVRRPQEEARVTHAQHQAGASWTQHRVVKVQSIAVEFLPVGLFNQRLELFELRSTRIRRQDLEVRISGIEIDSELDQLLDALFGVLQKSDHIKGRGRNAQLPTQLDHVAHVLVGNDAARNFPKDDRIRRLHTEIDIAQTRKMHGTNQI